MKHRSPLQRLSHFCGTWVYAFLTCEVTWLIVIWTLIWWALEHVQVVLK